VFSLPLFKRLLRGARHVNLSFECSCHVGTFPPCCVGYLRPPLCRVPLDALSFKTVLLLALVSAKRASELTALSVSLSCLLLNSDNSFALSRSNPMFFPKSIGIFFRSRDVVLKAFHSLPHASRLRLS